MPEVEALDIAQAFKLPPRQAIDFFRSKGHKIDWNWWDSWQDAHSKSFTVAKSMRKDVLLNIKDQVDKALAQGLTPKDFARTMEPRLKKLGWWGRQVIVDSQGRAEVVQLGSPHRLKTIYRTNMNTARAQAHYKNAKANAEDRPFWEYDAMDDALVRPSHAAMDGMVFRHDDPFWDSHYPPNGFNCRCRVRALDQADLDERGLEVTRGDGHLKEIEQHVGVDKRTGEVIKREGTEFTLGGKKMAPDPGWSYNPGASAVRQLQSLDIDKMQQSLTDGLSGVVRRDIASGLASPQFRHFIRTTKATDGELWAAAATTPERLKNMGLSGQSGILRMKSHAVDKADHRARFQDFNSEDWNRVQRLMDDGEWFENRPQHRALWMKDKGKHWILFLTQADTGEMFLETIFPTDAKYIARQIEKARKRKGG